MAKVIRVKLTDKRAGEHRFVSAAAATKDEAVAIVEAQEAGHVQFVLDASEAADLERKLREGTLSGREKGRLASHRQDRPYKVVKVEA